KRPTDRPTVAATPAAYEAPEAGAAPGAEANPFAESLAAPTLAEGVPTFLGEVIASGAGAPSWDDLTTREPAFDDITVPGDASQPLPREAYRAPPAADRDAIPTRAIELPREETDDEPARAEDTPDAGEEPVLAEADDAPDAPAQAAPPDVSKPGLDPRELDLEVERMLQAERAFRRGKRALKKQQLSVAIEHFSTAERLCPREGEFLAALGEALWREDPQTPRARPLLERGCDLAPHIPGPHLALAALLEGVDDAAGARVAYERALAADPSEAAAVEGLRQLESS
ncbi:MAG: hypothetical protein GXP55_07935, partial [Deltaproteobacteria bacterium]|nr:hypothetical protein [Deltaproteobacteria bacterium]